MILECNILTLLFKKKRERKANKHISQIVKLLRPEDLLVCSKKKIWYKIVKRLTCQDNTFTVFFPLPASSVFMINGTISDSYNQYKFDQTGRFYDILFHS